MSDNDYYGQGQSESPQMDMQQPGSMYSTPRGGAPMYGNGQSSLTDMRTSYGSDMPGMLAYGAASGISVVGQGAYVGANRMMADLGGMVRPISYTPPARVYTGYSGRVQQQTSFFHSMGAFTHWNDAPRGTSPYLYGLNSAYDVGERTALAGTGIAAAAAGIGVAHVASQIGGAAFGGIGSLAGGLLGYQAAAYATDKIYEGVATRRNTEDYLDRTSSQYIGSGSRDADSRTGAGFSRKARQDISEFIRGMDTSDRMLGGDDLQNILKGSTELGMFAGTQSTQDFKKKFKSIVENVKMVTTTLNQTIEEGLQTMKALKGAGILESGSGAMALQAQTLGKVAGRSASEMINLGLQGAEIYRGTGVEMGIGFQANMMNLASVKASRDAGIISQEAVAQAGGEEAMAQRMTGSTLAYTQSQIGRGFGAMYAGAGGTFNQQAFNESLSGNMDMGAAALKSARNLSSPRAMLEYEVNQEKTRSEQGKQYGGRGLDIGMMNEAVMQATSISRWTKADMDTSMLFVLKNQMGMSDMEARARIGEIKDPEKLFAAQQKAAQATMGQGIADQAIQNTAFYRMGAQIDDTVKGVADIVAKPAMSIYNSAAEGAAKLYDKRILGIERYDKSGSGYEIFDGDSVTAKQRVASHGRADLSKFTVGAKTAGSDLAARLLKSKGDKSSMFSDSGITQGGDTDIILDSGVISGNVGLNNKDFDRRIQEARMVAAVSPERAAALKDQGSLKDVLDKTEKGFAGISDFSKISGRNDLAKAIFGTTDLNEQQQAALVLTVKGTKYEKIMDEDRKTAIAYTAADTERFTIAQRTSLDVVAKASEKLGIGAITADSRVKGYYIKAMLTSNPEEKAKLLAKAQEVGISTHTLDISSDEWKKARARAEAPSASDLEQAGVIRDEFGVMSVREKSMGSNVLFSGMSGMLANSTALSTDERSKALHYARLVGGAGGADQAVNLVKDKAKYEEVQGLLAKAGDAGKTLSSTLTQVHAIDVLDGVADPTKRQAALQAAKIPQGMQQQLLDAYAAKGHAAVEDIVSKPARDSVGASGVSGAGNTSGVSSSPGTPQDVYAQQTAMNEATLAAFKALAAKLGVK